MVVGSRGGKLMDAERGAGGGAVGSCWPHTKVPGGAGIVVVFYWLVTQAACSSRSSSMSRRWARQDLLQAWWAWLQLGQRWTMSCFVLYLTRHSRVSLDPVQIPILMHRKLGDQSGGSGNTTVVQAPRGRGRKSPSCPRTTWIEEHYVVWWSIDVWPLWCRMSNSG